MARLSFNEAYANVWIDGWPSTYRLSVGALALPLHTYGLHEPLNSVIFPHGNPMCLVIHGVQAPLANLNLAYFNILISLRVKVKNKPSVYRLTHNYRPRKTFKYKLL